MWYQVLRPPHRSSAIGHRPSAIGHRPSAIGHRSSDIGYRISGIGYRVPGIGYRVSGIAHPIAARNIQTAIAHPTPIFIAVATARPMSAPVAARVDAPVLEPMLSSPASAPMKLPTNPPTIGPTIGMGTPMIAPITPPIMAPQPARRDPPYFRAYLPDIVNSIHSAMTASIAIPTSVTQLIGSVPTRMLYTTALAIMIQRPGSPSAMSASDRTSTSVSRMKAIS